MHAACAQHTHMIVSTGMAWHLCPVQTVREVEELPSTSEPQSAPRIQLGSDNFSQVRPPTMVCRSTTCRDVAVV